MNARRWEQFAAAGGILFVVLQITSQALIQTGGAEPPFNAGAADILAFFGTRNARLFGWGDYLQSLSLIAWVFFLGALWARLRRAEQDPGWLALVALACGLLLGASLFGGGGWTLAMARIGDGLNPEIARLLFDQGNLSFANIWVLLAGMLLAAGIGSLTSGALPAWLSWAALVIALGLVVARAFWASGNAALFIPYLLFWLWVIVTSIVLIRQVEQAM
jgi:hypothetical protein